MDSLRHDTIHYDGASLARQIGMLTRSGSGDHKATMSLFNTVTQVRQRLSPSSTETRS